MLIRNYQSKSLVLITSIFLFISIFSSSASADKENRIKIIRVKNHLYFKASICGVEGLFLLDSGANTSMLSTEIAEKLLENKLILAFDRKSGRAVTFDKTNILQKGSGSLLVESFKIGTMEIKNIGFGYSRNYDINKLSMKYDKVPCLGLIGMNVFKEIILTIDYQSRELAVYPNNGVVKPEIQTIEYDFLPESINRLIAHIKLGKPYKSSHTFLIDTGAGGIGVNPEVAEDWDIIRNSKGQKGSWNQAETIEYYVSLLIFDRFYLRDFLVKVFDEDTEYSDEEDGLLGNSFLENFNSVTFDTDDGKLYLGPVVVH